MTRFPGFSVSGVGSGVCRLTLVGAFEPLTQRIQSGETRRGRVAMVCDGVHAGAIQDRKDRGV